MDPSIRAGLEQARALLATRARVAVFSGAGLSAESGLATFRDADPDALWSRYDPTELASVAGFEANPQRVIEWYNWRRGICAKAQPNAAHRALAMQSRMVQITQNVDHLLEQAGAPPQRIYHLHGSILRDRCHNTACDHREQIDLAKPSMLRACPHCGAHMRPAVVWFGENLPAATWDRAQRLCMSLDCLLVIGTSATVYPAAGLISLAKHHGSRIIVIDPNSGAAGDSTDLYLAGSAGDLVPALLDGFNLASE